MFRLCFAWKQRVEITRAWLYNTLLAEAKAGDRAQKQEANKPGLHAARKRLSKMWAEQGVSFKRTNSSELLLEHQRMRLEEGIMLQELVILKDSSLDALCLRCNGLSTSHSD